MERGAFSVYRILRETVKGSDGHEQGRQLGMIDDFEMQFLLADFCIHAEVERNHRRRSAEPAGNRGEMVAGNSADGAADIHDFREARSEESVVSTRLRAIGIWTSPRFRNGCPQRKTRSACTAVTVQAEFIDASPCTRTIPAISPGTMCPSSGRGVEVPPCAATKP